VDGVVLIKDRIPEPGTLGPLRKVEIISRDVYDLIGTFAR